MDLLFSAINQFHEPTEDLFKGYTMKYNKLFHKYFTNRILIDTLGDEHLINIMDFKILLCQPLESNEILIDAYKNYKNDPDNIYLQNISILSENNLLSNSGASKYKTDIDRFVQYSWIEPNEKVKENMDDPTALSLMCESNYMECIDNFFLEYRDVVETRETDEEIKNMEKFDYYNNVVSIYYIIGMRWFIFYN